MGEIVLRLVAILIIMAIFFVLGLMEGWRWAIDLCVRSEMKEKGQYDGTIPDIQLDYIADRRDKFASIDNTPGPDYYRWIRRYKMPNNIETRNLYNNPEYRAQLGEK
jgi:hypothetical protein